MVHFILMLHILGFGMAFAAAVGSYAVLLVTNSGPAEHAPVLNRVPPKLAQFGRVGFGIAFVTGPLLLWLKWGFAPAHWTTFWVKIALVVALLVMMIVYGRGLKRAERGGDQIACGRLAIYNRIVTSLLILIVVFAVLAFG
ncbi:MAG TPA: CopD family protein [Bauldia sp.]|nr:CopD family protein [Bauldia sp.]